MMEMFIVFQFVVRVAISNMVRFTINEKRILKKKQNAQISVLAFYFLGITSNIRKESWEYASWENHTK